MGHNWKSYSCNRKELLKYDIPRVSSKRPEALLVSIIVVVAIIGLVNLLIIAYNGVISHGKK